MSILEVNDILIGRRRVVARKIVVREPEEMADALEGAANVLLHPNLQRIQYQEPDRIAHNDPPEVRVLTGECTATGSHELGEEATRRTAKTKLGKICDVPFCGVDLLLAGKRRLPRRYWPHRRMLACWQWELAHSEHSRCWPRPHNLHHDFNTECVFTLRI